MPSLFGKSTVDPTGTASRRGWNVLFFCASVNRRGARRAAASIGSAYTTALAGAVLARATLRTTPPTGPATACATKGTKFTKSTKKTDLINARRDTSGFVSFASFVAFVASPAADGLKTVPNRNDQPRTLEF